VAEPDTRYVALVVARLGSSRLPRKHLSPVLGQPMIAHVIRRVWQAQRVHEVVLCTSVNPIDDELVLVAESLDVPVVRGSEMNLLKRLTDAAMERQAELNIIVEADEVMCDWELIDALIERYESTAEDYLTLSGAPLGTYLHAVRTEALQRACAVVPAEAVTDDGWNRYFTESAGPSFSIGTVAVDPELHTDSRMTLDWPEDLALITAIYERLGRTHIFTLHEAVQLLRDEPVLHNMNQHLVEVYAQRVQNFEPLSFIGGVVS
jgi:spore coat polysaccharide biosynthesis protein SpsF